MNMLKAGLGKAEVLFTDEMLPIGGENYNSIHDLPYVKVLLLEGSLDFAFVAMGLVMGDREYFRSIAAESLGISKDHVILHLQHILATPHFDVNGSAQDQQLAKAYADAVRSACQMAKASLFEAKLGVGKVTAKVTVNRVVKTNLGYWQGVNDQGPTDDEVFILKVCDAEGSVKGVLFNVNVAPGVMEFSQCNGGRAISGDLAAASERFIEKELADKAVAIYMTGATGDQWQALRARLDYIQPDGTQVIRDLGEAGFTLLEILATRLGEKVVAGLADIETVSGPQITWQTAEFMYDHQSVKGADPRFPAVSCEYIVEGKDPAGAAVLTMDDTAIVFCGSELNVSTLAAIKKGSSYAKTFICEFSTVGGGYMPPSDFYDMVTFQSIKCHYAKGTAEKLAEDFCAMLTK